VVDEDGVVEEDGVVDVDVDVELVGVEVELLVELLVERLVGALVDVDVPDPETRNARVVEGFVEVVPGRVEDDGVVDEVLVRDVLEAATKAFPAVELWDVESLVVVAPAA
jgi:hypothetical protein